MNPRQRLGEQMLRTAYWATIFFALCAGAAYGQDRPKSLQEFWRDTPAGWQCPFSNSAHSANSANSATAA
jgi:hypothetical protein